MAQQVTGYPLSPQQKRLWSLEKNQSASKYRSHAVIRMEGSLQQEYIRKVIELVVQENEILRTLYRVVPGMDFPLQIVQETANVSLSWEEVSELSLEELNQKIEQRLRELHQQQVERSEEDPVCAALLQTGDDRYVLLLAWPSLSLDLEMQHLIQELAAAYQRLLLGDQTVDEEKIQYAVAGEIFNEILTSEEGEVARDYWRKQDFKEAFSTGLPFATSAQSQAAFNPQQVEAKLDNDTTERLKALSKQNGTPLEYVYLAGWAALLGRLTAHEFVHIGRGFTGRIDEEIAQAIGPYGKYLPLQMAYHNHQSFLDLLQQVGQTIEVVQEWQDGFDWEDLAGDMKSAEAHYLPFGFDYTECGAITSGGTTFTVEQTDAITDRFQIRLAGRSLPDGVRIVLHFNADDLMQEDAQRVLGNYLELMQEAVATPQTEVGAINLLDAKQREDLLQIFGEVATSGSSEKLHELFEDQVLKTPDRVAVTFENDSLSYAELNAKANQLARFLQKSGVKKNDFVGLCMERSLEMVVGILATLKAGAAYLPIDPEYPAERVAYMLENSGAQIVLAQSQHAEKLPEVVGRIFRLDGADAASIASESEGNLESECSDECPAYIIYTSGSTGRPKGVVIPHRAIVNHMLWFVEEFSLTENDVVLQKTSFSFDASVWEFFAPLLIGAELVMARPGGQADPDYLIREIQARQVTILQVVPSLLSVIVDRPGFDACGSLNRLFCGGEALSPQLVKRVHAKLDSHVVNLYGPTECCIDATFWVCQPGADHLTIPIGRPITNMQACVLDEYENLVPFGVPGELHLGGYGLALGYHAQAELTAEKFITNRHTPQHSPLLYKTGDLVRHLPDGSLEYLGRIDHQVKIRGFRIELGEVEAVLAQHPSVKQTIVVAHQDDHAGQRLVAYVAVEDGGTVDSGEVLAYAQKQLPDYMVPSLLVTLPAFPLTPNGKVDRRALPAPDFSRVGQAEKYVAPESDIEVLLTEVWADVLGVDQVGIKNNFFELGGHSLLATQIIYRLREQLDLDIPLRNLFEAPTIEQFAIEIEDLLLSELEELSEEETIEKLQE